MLTVTRPQRQAIFTLALVLLTVAPTCYIVLTAWRINRPGHLHEVESEIGRQLGLKVTLEGVRYPQPGEVVYQGAVLWQQEPRQKTKLVEVARADSLRLVREGRQIILRAEGLRLIGEGPKQGMEQVGAILSRAGQDSWDRVSISADTCEILLGDASEPDSLSYELRDLAGSFRIDQGMPTVEASYRVVTTDSSANRCELVLTRDRGGKDVRTTLTLRTAEGLPLQASPVLDPFFQAEDWLGPKAKVQGELTLSKAGAEDWQAEFAGTLIDVDLAALVGRRVPDHRLSGAARIAIENARWGHRENGQGTGWISASGELTAGPGNISASLLQALRTEMRFRLDPRLDLRRDDLEFQNFGLAFTMNSEGEIALKGALGNAFDPGVVLVEPDGLGSMAFAPDGASNLIGLSRTLGQAEARPDLLVPLTEELQFLKYLPIPTGPRGSHAVGN